MSGRIIDFQAGLLSIRRTSQYVAGKGVFTDETKTYHSRRVLKLTDTALTLLRQHHAVQMQNRLRLGDCWQEHDRIFTRWDGTPINPNSLTHRFHTFIHHTDLPPVTVHSLRHTNATLLIAEGAGVKVYPRTLGILPSVSPVTCMPIPCNRSKLQPQKRSKTRSRRPYAADVSASNKHQINTKLRKHTKCSFLFSPKKLQKTPVFRRIRGFCLVPVTGLEPVRCRQRWILSPLRLPIPSHRQIGGATICIIPYRSPFFKRFQGKNLSLMPITNSAITIRGRM